MERRAREREVWTAGLFSFVGIVVALLGAMKSHGLNRHANKGAPNAHATSLMGSVTKALAALQVRRIAVGTPYAHELTDTVVGYLQNEAGFEITAYAGLGLDYDRDMVRVTPDYLLEFGASLDTPEADALLISCSALRSLEIVEALEKEIRKPVIVSNQAMMWNCLRLAGVQDRLSGFGELLRQF